MAARAQSAAQQGQTEVETPVRDPAEDSFDVEPGASASMLSLRGITIPQTLEKLHKLHRRAAVATYSFVAVCILQFYAVSNTGWVEDPGSNSTFEQSRIHRCSYWRMFLLPVTGLIAVFVLKHLPHHNLSGSLTVGQWFVIIYMILYILWAVWLAIEAFWWCSSHMYDYCTDTVTEDLTTSYWIFIVSAWVGAVLVLWNFTLIRSLSKYTGVLNTLRGGLTERELQRQLDASLLGNARYVEGIGSKYE
jgi:hypothetical protein